MCRVGVRDFLFRLTRILSFQVLDPKLELIRLAADNWSSLQPRAVVLQRYDLTDATITPVWSWQRVTHLTLSNNKLRVVPDLDLPALEYLDISRNQLEQISARLLLPKLVHLDLSQNKIELLDLRHAGKELGNMFFVVIFLPLSQMLCD